MRITGEMGNLAAWEKRLFYMCSARPTLHPRALFSDVTSDYRSPAEPVHWRLGDFCPAAGRLEDWIRKCRGLCGFYCFWIPH